MTQTHWVLELPEAFPVIAVREPGRSGVRSADPAFAAALATPGVVDETAAGNLWGWHIDGRDLILSRTCPDPPCPATELAAVAERLAALYYRFPLDAVRRFGGPIDGAAGLPCHG